MYAKEKERHKNSRKNYNYLWLPYSLLLLGVPFQVGLSAVSFFTLCKAKKDAAAIPNAGSKAAFQPNKHIWRAIFVIPVRMMR